MLSVRRNYLHRSRVSAASSMRFEISPCAQNENKYRGLDTPLALETPTISFFHIPTNFHLFFRTFFRSSKIFEILRLRVLFIAQFRSREAGYRAPPPLYKHALWHWNLPTNNFHERRRGLPYAHLRYIT